MKGANGKECTPREMADEAWAWIQQGGIPWYLVDGKHTLRAPKEVARILDHYRTRDLYRVIR